MHILITNDDGISSIGIKALAEAALERGHKVTISAPQGQCSANGQHISLTAPLLVHQVPWKGADAYAVAGTPCDCVRLAPCMTDTPFDFCISGINNGENAGSGIYYSGTVSAAREAVMLYIPAIAVSIMSSADDEMRKNIAAIAVQTAEKFLHHPLPRFTLINLNAPAIAPHLLKPMVVCPLSRAYYLDSYEKRVSPLGQTYFWLTANDTSGVPMEKPEEGSDYDYLLKGHLTCTFIGNIRDYNDDYSSLMQE